MNPPRWLAWGGRLGALPRGARRRWLFMAAPWVLGMLAGLPWWWHVTGSAVQGVRDGHWADDEWRWQLALASGLLLLAAVILRYLGQTLTTLAAEHHRQRELEEANHALREANERLQSLQQDLVRAQRLSSLGLMVAGVAHELNTPLGTAGLAMSSLAEKLAGLRERLATGLRRSELDGFLATAAAASALVQGSLGRASSIVRRFKQVAVDRGSMERRRFDLAEVVLDADPRLRRWRDVGRAVGRDVDGGGPGAASGAGSASASGQVFGLGGADTLALSLDLAPGLQMDSYPGPLEQVVSNLLGNALAHAFPDGLRGTIRIETRADGPAGVRIRFMDDGVGIPPHDRERAFDPFFTTRRHAGGTGLGLHICSQIVTEVLGGRMRIADVPAPATGGTCFEIHLPRNAPMLRPSAAGP